jgi:hypothetical protein
VSGLILRPRPSFETHGFAALLRMRTEFAAPSSKCATHTDLILRSDPQDRVSKDEGSTAPAAILRDARLR